MKQSPRPRANSPRRLSLLIGLVLACSCQAQRDPVTDFCRRFGHQTAVIDRRLYIDGGLVNWNPMQSDPANYSNTWLLYQDLDHNSDSSMPALHANLSKNSTVPNVSGGFLWADDVNKMLFLFGGEYYQQPPPANTLALWAYDVLHNYWIQRSPPPASQTNVYSVAYGAGVSVSDRGEGYYYGGWLSNTSVAGWSGPPLASSGLLRYNLDASTWANNTGPDDVRRAEGVLLYLPAGDGGLLVYFGGVIDPYANGTVSEQSLDTVFIYDVLSSKWYSQNTTGSIPGDRRRFCAGVTWTEDRSSYNIYIYGGAGFPPATAGYDDVYVLSIPSFTWIKLYPTDGNYTGSYPHHSLSCNVVSGAQMLIIGGSFPLTDDCDAASQWGTHNVDLTESRPPNRALWQLFDPNETVYNVPSPVLSAIGGAGSGGATVTAPAAGWDSPDLAVLLTRTASVAVRTATRAITSSTSTAVGHSGNSSPLSKGAIAGVAIGAAVAVVLLGSSCWWVLLQRYRRRLRGGTTGQGGRGGGGGRGGYYSGGHIPPPQVGMMGMQSGFTDSHGSAQPLSSSHPGNWSPQHHGITAGYSLSSPYSLFGSAAGGDVVVSQPVELAGSGTSALGATSPVGSGSGTGNSEALERIRGVLVKVDDQDRVWMPTETELQLPPGQTASPALAIDTTAAIGSAGRNTPQELSSTRGEQQDDRSGRHDTFYHP
ncbi:hypothetical protein CMQ_1613 [Grosmannia clavigera kw1407]|uniref:Kelch repeat protein n=1 Tax=Grosmannia clavigera (strain kw1407 / UAMH 11150) TaxID=655863 RepID=F0XC34_GROCL|nr:uncharacterized protein CMQ_1613 [Grosmannia clavigera kw1407]EFX04685.1 hypothetical protein CMQ_1613 [Grosmannia clavigera kw1407]